MSLLEIEKLRISSGDRILLNEISFSLNAGEALGLVGASGSGKSLTSLAVMGLLPPQLRVTGSIRLNGRQLVGAGEKQLQHLRGQEMGIIFQEPLTALNPVQTITAQVAEPFRLHRRLSRQAARREAVTLLERVELPHAIAHGKYYPHQLSGGQRQRVAIAIAIALKPKLLIADEPTTALDSLTEAQILALLSSLAHEDGAGLLFISHNLSAVARVAKRLAVVSTGRIVEEGPVSLLVENARNPVTASFAAAEQQDALRDLWPATSVQDVPRLAVQNMTHHYHGADYSLFGPKRSAPAVQDISFSIAPRESVGLIGPSGSGKTTILRSLLGLLEPEKGDVLIDGESLFSASAAKRRMLRRKIQIVFQDPYSSFDPRWRVRDLIAEPLALYDKPCTPADIRQKVIEMLELVGLTGKDAERFPHEFSGGQRQRIAIARALIVNPALVVFDEATSALDLPVRAQILNFLSEIAKNRDISYLFVTHDLSLVRSITHRVLVLEKGRIIESGSTQDVLHKPQQVYTAQLVAAAPKLEDVLKAQAA